MQNVILYSLLAAMIKMYSKYATVFAVCFGLVRQARAVYQTALVATAAAALSHTMK